MKTGKVRRLETNILPLRHTASIVFVAVAVVMCFHYIKCLLSSDNLWGDNQLQILNSVCSLLRQSEPFSWIFGISVF